MILQNVVFSEVMYSVKLDIGLVKTKRQLQYQNLNIAYVRIKYGVEWLESKVPLVGSLIVSTAVADPRDPCWIYTFLLVTLG